MNRKSRNMCKWMLLVFNAEVLGYLRMLDTRRGQGKPNAEGHAPATLRGGAHFNTTSVPRQMVTKHLLYEDLYIHSFIH